MSPPENFKKWNREPTYDASVPYWCIRLTTHAWNSRLFRLAPKKEYHIYIARSTYYNVYARRTQVNCIKETTKRKGDSGKERKEKTRSGRKMFRCAGYLFWTCAFMRNGHCMSISFCCSRQHIFCDRSITHCLQRWVTIKYSISQLECVLF